jgi:hypothetical protein
MAQRMAPHGGGLGSSHFHLPAQMLLGFLFMAFGGLFLLKKIGNDYLPFIPEEVFIYVTAVGSLLGGFYLIISQIWKPRIYLR